MNTDQKIFRNKDGFVNLDETPGNVSRACKVMGYSHDSFYCYKELYDRDDELAIPEINRKKLYHLVEEVQADADEQIKPYNEERTKRQVRFRKDAVGDIY